MTLPMAHLRRKSHSRTFLVDLKIDLILSAGAAAHVMEHMILVAVWRPHAVPGWLTINVTQDHPGDQSHGDYI